MMMVTGVNIHIHGNTYDTDHVRFRGIPVSEIISIDIDHAEFVLADYDASLYHGDLVVMYDSLGRHGAIATHVDYEGMSRVCMYIISYTALPTSKSKSMDARAVWDIHGAKNGDLDSVVTVTGDGFVNTTDLVCGFARVVSGEYPGVFDGRRVQCYDGVIRAMIVSHALFVNNETVNCTFGGFFKAKNFSFSDPWYDVDPADSAKMACLSAYHLVYVGNTIDQLVLVTGSEVYEYMTAAQTKVIQPSRANYMAMSSVVISGTSIASVGIPRCWCAQLLNDNTDMPASPWDIPSGNYSSVYDGVFIKSSDGASNQVRCLLPQIDGIEYVGFVVSNDGIFYNSSSFVTFRYLKYCQIDIHAIPSNVTYNTIPLSVQPIIQVTDIDFNPIPEVFQVNVTILPFATSVVDGSVMSNGTGYAVFTSLTIAGPQYLSFEICYQAESSQYMSAWYCSCCTDVAPCNAIDPNTVEYNLNCVCAVGYELTVDGCQKCGIGSYRSDLSSSQCTACLEHTTTASTGSMSSDDCICVRASFVQLSNGSCTCPAGYEYDVYNDNCVPCMNGTYKDVQGMSMCVRCDVQHDWNLSPAGATSYDQCVCLDTYTQLANGSCTCPPGYEPGLFLCVACVNGTYKETQGLVGCVVCDMGQYGTSPSGSSSYAQCVCMDTFQYDGVCSCPPGRYYAASTNSCIECDLGQYKVGYGEPDACVACGPRETTEFHGSTSASDCICDLGHIRSNVTDPTSECVCDVGYEFIVTNATCMLCQAHFIKISKGLQQCTACHYSMGTVDNNRDRCVCRPGYYTDRDPSPSSCTSCPAGGYCSGGLAVPVSMPGYYQSTTGNFTFVECSPPSACTGADMCYTGYTGYVCASCDIGYYKERDGSCQSCGSSQDQVLAILSAMVIIIPLVFLSQSVDGNKNDARFGLSSIVTTWMQFTGM